MGRHATSNGSPAKKAKLPRPNKAGKRPHNRDRIRQLTMASIRARRNRVNPGRHMGLNSIDRTKLPKHIPKNDIQNPSKVPGHKGLNTVRAKKIRNPKSK